MKIHAITVSVNYADILEQCLPTWFPGIHSLVVVTSTRDIATRELCHRHGISHHSTDVFYRRGAAFNKWAAVQQAINIYGTGPEWFLLIDADMKLPRGWKDAIEEDWKRSPGQLQPVGVLFGCRRQMSDGTPIPDLEPVGCFMLMHTNDPAIRGRQLFDMNWNHAGNGDTVLMQRWPMGMRRWLPFTAEHIGTPGQNWFGRGKLEDMQKMRQDRAAGGSWMNERVPS